ncbi:tetratricopeptide repeat protein [Nonomuraea sp. NPDC050022]|uniref:tetratricopeptide repeat protein n=1 Tax=Nonomuraea sp. NPDC050022 TaxID=3364358 RepID=UPI0037B047A0
MRQLNPDLDPGHQVWQATIGMRKGQVEQARAQLREMTEQPHRDHSPRNAAFAHCGLGDLARLEGDLATAAREYERSAATLEYASAIAPQFRALVMIGRAHLALAVGDPAATGQLRGAPDAFNPEVAPCPRGCAPSSATATTPPTRRAGAWTGPPRSAWYTPP